MAGTRTNGLVASGSCAFVMMGMLAGHDPSGISRIIGQVVTGVGFLCAGVIFREGANIRGLNTSATIWVSAAVGALSALGFPLHSLALAGFVLLTNITLRPLAYKLRPVGTETYYVLTFSCHMLGQQEAREFLMKTVERLPPQVQSVSTEVHFEEVWLTAVLMTLGRNDQCVDRLAGILSRRAGVSKIEWRLQPQPASLDLAEQSAA